MIVKCINSFLNSSLKSFCNKHRTSKVAGEGILMPLYTWNFSQVVATDISQSLIVFGFYLQFPIYFCTDHHCILNSNPARVTNYAADQARILSYTCAIAKKLIHHHRVYHLESIIYRLPNPPLYSENDMVFAKRYVKYNKWQGLVRKPLNLYTGPYQVNKRPHSSFYELVHNDTYWPVKKHTAHLSPFPQELVPSQPVNRADNRLFQIYAPIQSHPYKDSDIKGFTASASFKSASHTTGLSAMPSPEENLICHTIAELKYELFE